MIRGQTANLRKMRMTDLGLVYKWWDDGALAKYYDRNPIFSREEIEAETRRNVSAPDRLDFIIESRTEEPVGLIYLKNIDWINRNCELHAMVGERDHRHIYCGVHAEFLLLMYSFRQLNMHKVYARVIEFGSEQRRLVEAVGFVEEAVSKQFVYQQGKYWDLHIYAILDWEFEVFLNSSKGRKYIAAFH